MAAEIALSHHEKYDGSGYSRGLKGEEIPLSARIVAITDVYDALRQERAYKPAFTHDKSFKIIIPKVMAAPRQTNLTRQCYRHLYIPQTNSIRYSNSISNSCINRGK
jgi:HD-GYP domain-containing protein (c-di-GMP phosphodiesterase class II)